ncbi:putative lipoprotein [Paraburkholderia ribeironis]|uniref:Putative lipoprotein n=1 Tax=Paraburkholderia ribeironis TaxID=1247936 RepID=A0A1N7RRZ2_9BURK|nr:hypothetical protein [Paraburkholderia ribeironis]SIT37846.1 putative lipoprotein [Paraburkholderia ribeironis]
MNYPASLLRHTHAAAVLAAVLTIVAGSAALAGCAEPPGPSPIYSRLPPDQTDAASTAPLLTPEELARYDAIDRQVLFEQDQAIAAESAAQAWSRYYSPPVSVFGGYATGGWGRGWGTGIGVGFGPRWGW